MSEERCEAIVYVRDTYRVSRGRGFKMHYERRRCSRKGVDNGLCRQHAKIAQYVVRDHRP